VRLANALWGTLNSGSGLVFARALLGAYGLFESVDNLVELNDCPALDVTPYEGEQVVALVGEVYVARAHLEQMAARRVLERL
jgi:hypothetical protein